MAKITLDSLLPGQSGVIAAVGGDGALRRRLLDMGVTPRTAVLLRKVAPMGDPLELFLRSYTLTLRKEEAAKIELDPASIATAGDPYRISGGGCSSCSGCASCASCSGAKQHQREGSV